MNANELAEELENKPLAYGDDIQEWLSEAATMLRQQQAEIEALKKRCLDEIFNRTYADRSAEVMCDYWELAQAEVDRLKVRIERMIENQSHHEGIAHAGGFESGYQAAKSKTLTDEEINVVAILQDAEIVPVGHEIWKTGEEFNKYKKIVLATAKALRKAQEK